MQNSFVVYPQTLNCTSTACTQWVGKPLVEHLFAHAIFRTFTCTITKPRSFSCSHKVPSRSEKHALMEGPWAAMQETSSLLLLAKALAYIESSFPDVKGKEPINMCEKKPTMLILECITWQKYRNIGRQGENKP